MLQTVRNGSRNVDTALLQALLNKQGASPRLAVDGVFGRKTDQALRQYQRTKPALTANGVADQSVWNSLPYIIRETRHNVTLRAQTGQMGCWSAAAGMITNAQMSHGSGNAGTGTSGALAPTLANVQTFVQGLGWRMRTNQSAPSANAIAQAMARGPVWVGFVSTSFKHVVVFSKILTDGTDEGTAIEVMDPWPVGSGTQYSTGYRNAEVTLRSDPVLARGMVQFVAGP